MPLTLTASQVQDGRGAAAASALQAPPAATRPSRQLSRRDTQREARQNAKIYVDRWQSGPFADAPERRVMGMGPKVHTQAHEDLLRRMRMEGARVSQELAESRKEATLTHDKHVETWRKLHAARQDLAVCQAECSRVTQELILSQAALEDIDVLWAINKQKRASHLSQSGKAQNLAVLNRTHTPDLHPAAGPSRAAAD